MKISMFDLVVLVALLANIMLSIGGYNAAWFCAAGWTVAAMAHISRLEVLK